ncbi:recombinase family protein [Vibrio metoecus]|uniref:recombinase family protein n=1 Tax=Vibrio metoecus TaxID=1481663 RepID=UPI0012AE92A7|nr:recombinase family protein [Vibrio metoecus]
MDNRKVLYPYIRFSKDEQKHGTSYERQMDKIEKYAADNDFVIDDTLNLKDLGLSAFKGKHKDKGALGGSIKAIEKKSIPVDGSSYLCIEQFDRLSREDVDTAYQLFRSILKANVNIITLMDKRIYTKESLNDMMSIIYSIMLMSQANVESQKKSERITASYRTKLDKVKSGENILFAARYPEWIDNQGSIKDRQFVLNDKAEIVRRIFQLYLDGVSMNGIARIFNDEGIAPFMRTKNSINQWSSGNVSSILRNRCVVGDLCVSRTGDIIKGYYPPVISVDDFEATEGLRDKKRTLKTAGKPSINVFTGKVFCVECGRKFYFEKESFTYKGQKNIYHFLKCSGKRNNGGCHSLNIKYEDFLDATKAPLKMKMKKDPKKVGEIEDHISKIRGVVKELDGELAQLDLMLDSGEINATIYAKTASKLEDKLVVERKRIASYKQKIAQMNNDLDFDSFDIHDPKSINKVKKYINDNYAAFIVSSYNKTILSLSHTGGVIITPFKHKKSLAKDSESVKDFYTLQADILDQYKRGEMDNKFTEILEATNFWGIETPETDYSFE